MRRFFVPPQLLHQEEVLITGPLARHIQETVSPRESQSVVLLDSSGWEYHVTLSTVAEEHLAGRIVKRALAAGEPRTKIALYQGLLSQDAFARVLRVGTELGLVEFVPVVSERCAVATLDELREGWPERWQEVVWEAAERAGRGQLPRLRPVTFFDQACSLANRSGRVLLLCPEAGTNLRRVLTQGETKLRPEGSTSRPRSKLPFSFNILVGPGEGFTAQEIERAQRYGTTLITCGSRPLDSEVAGLVISALILYELGDLA